MNIVLMVGMILVLFFIMIPLSEASSNELPFICFILIISFVIWWIIAGQIDFKKYESKTYNVLEDNNTQYIIIDKEFININDVLGKYVKTGQKVKVTNPTSNYAGGIYWVGHYTKYEIIEEE